jgi:hypothetical protein
VDSRKTIKDEKMKKLLFIAVGCILSLNGHSQPQLLWQKCLGGTAFEEARSLLETGDGGYLITGTTSSNDGNVSGNHGNGDLWIVKIGTDQTLLWQRCLGGSGLDEGKFAQKTQDGNYIVCGLTNSNDGDVSGNHGGYDMWVLKLDTSGNILWQKCLGGTSNEYGEYIQETNDGGYILTGCTSSNDGNISGNHGAFDVWVAKLSSTGTIEWQKCFGGTREEWVKKIIELNGGEYLVSATTRSTDGDVTGNHGNYDSWFIRLDANGEKLWMKCCGGTLDDLSSGIESTPDGGFISSSLSFSNDGDVSGNHGSSDYWIIKHDNAGNIQWQSCLGGSAGDDAFCLKALTDKEYIVSGYTESYDGNVSGNHGQMDIWVVKIDSIGSLIWQKCLGGTNNESAMDVIQASDGGYLLAGNTYSNDGDVTGNHGDKDYWIIKLQETVSVGKGIQYPGIYVSPIPASDYLNINFHDIPSLVKISVLTGTGKTIIPDAAYDMEMIRLDVSFLSPGLYILKVTSANNRTMYRKFIVMR